LLEQIKVVLISTYEMGRQPFGIASPAAWLRESGVEVTSVDLSREPLPDQAIRTADLVAFYVPMHTATRLAVRLLPIVREIHPRVRICFYGLYAPVNEAYLRKLGVEWIFGGEFETSLTALATRLANPGRDGQVSASPPANDDVRSTISLARQQFRVPDRSDLVALGKYARLLMPDGESRTVGYTEASRGCKHLCRHCPIVPVYNGIFRIVDREVVLADIRQQVAAGARHITFGDPDFFNGVGHALPLVEALHGEFPHLTYDVTIKVEHLLKGREFLATLRDTGCLFVTSAVESVDDGVLQKLGKNHTRADFLRVVAILGEIGLTLAPTFVAFTPWTTLAGYGELLETIRQQNLVENVAPIQLAIRLLVPARSRLLELRDVRELVGPFDEQALVYPWKHKDPRVDALCNRLQGIVHAGEKMNRPRGGIFELIEDAAEEVCGRAAAGAAVQGRMPVLAARATIPYLNEPWYC